MQQVHNTGDFAHFGSLESFVASDTGVQENRPAVEENGRTEAKPPLLKHAKTVWIKSRKPAPAAIKTALESFDRSIETLYAIIAKEHENLYIPFGFSTIAQINFWSRHAAHNVPLLHFSARSAEPKLRELLHIDGACWQERRSELISALLKSAACIYFREQRGFLFYSEKGDKATVELWEMSEGKTSTARNMLRSALYRLKDRQVHLASPANNAIASAILKEHGFQIADSALLMSRGKRRKIKFENVFAL